MALLIGLGTALYHTGIRLVAPFVPKARQWIEGRKGLWQRLEAKADQLQGCVWIHCASVGEFEQARPVLDAIQRERPDLPTLITFFSPSGYEARKHFAGVTHVEYLPPDTAANAKRFIDLVRPKLVIFIKYEFWHQHLMALSRGKTPTFLVSGIFRPSQPFFRWYGAEHRAMLRTFRTLFVQNTTSLELLRGLGITNVVLSGDTRFDRVVEITTQPDDLPIAVAFRKASSYPVLVAGSSWPADERIIAQAVASSSKNIRCVVVPHELSTEHFRAVVECMPAPVIRWNDIATVLDLDAPGKSDPDTPEEDPLNSPTLLVDRMGLLSRLYKYADITYVGGGFGSGIHNTLEAAAWGKPVIFGPNYDRFAEAHGLIEARAGFAVKNAQDLHTLLQRFVTDPVALEQASMAARRYVTERAGATAQVMAGIRNVL